MAIESKMRERNNTIDLLRVIGTFLVILAHMSVPKTLNNIRSFDVCMLVMISGMSYILSSSRKNCLEYLVSRCKRLVVPAYIAASIIFVSCLLLCLLVKREYPYSYQQILETYLFIGGRSGGIGYFWIVRIYLIVAVFSPWLQRLSVLIKSDLKYSFVVIGILVLNEIIILLCFGKYGKVCDFIIENYISSTLAYSSIAMIGMRIQEKPRYTKFFLPFVTIGMALIAFCNRKCFLIDIGNYKYPPQLTYLMYGLFISLLLVSLFNCEFTKKVNISSITWLSRNSFSIYLSHIIVLFVMSWGNKILSQFEIFENWLIKYFVVLILSILGVVLTDWLVLVVRSWRKKRI